MPSNRTVKPGINPHCFVGEDGRMLRKPKGWELLLPGDAALTKAVKSMGPTWSIKTTRGRRIYSQGILAPAQNIQEATSQLEQKRSTPAYRRQLLLARQRRQEKELAYVEEFAEAVKNFLGFSQSYEFVAIKISRLIAEHATPVGSGTVARTKRIEIEERAKRATMAWLRHQTTQYDSMQIPLIKGKRREVRRQLAKDSHSLLAQYRCGQVKDRRLIELAEEKSIGSSPPTL
jgi:hypothetical protein